MLAACPRTITDSNYVLSVSPPSASLFVTESARLTATLRDSEGNPVSTEFIWESANTAVATVDASGMVQAVGVGSTTVEVSARGEVASATVVVEEDNGQSLSVTPAAANLFVNATQRLTATLKDRNGNTIPSTPEWSSSNTAVATVDATGLVRGIGVGSATVQARVGNLTDQADVEVAARPNAVVFVGAGDIAKCNSGGDEQTANLLDKISGTVFTLGDNAYENGSVADYENCYAPSWGRHKSRTRPVPGNHEFFTFGGAGYFGYFGEAAGDPTKGYYSYDLGYWHILALNSSGDVSAGSVQEQWVRADLAAHSNRCTLAYFHHPLFSSGPHGHETSASRMKPIWQALYDAGADVVLSGHDHTYERFAPQTSAGVLDMSRGIRQFVVGTGGGGLYEFGAIIPNSEVRSSSTRGVLKMTLYPDRYDWQFVPAGSTFTDNGSASCH
jgi:hypothetical protein